jgi:hypothetical protein
MENFFYLKDKYEFLKTPIDFVSNVFSGGKNYVKDHTYNATGTTEEKINVIVNDSKIEIENKKNQMNQFINTTKDEINSDLEKSKENF